MKRKSISEKVRFEVFKRDSFKCQYCGRCAPDVLLRLDHIEPHSKGGSDNITNLITACFECNSGKGAVRLSDTSLIQKTREQCEELQEKRNQLEAMMQWRKKLMHADKSAAAMAGKMWEDLTPGYTLNEHGLKLLSSWIRKFGFDPVLEAMSISSEHYLRRDNGGTLTNESVNLAFSKIPGVCYFKKVEKDDPKLRDALYLRGVARNTFTLTTYEQHLILNLIRKLLVNDESKDDLKREILSAKSKRVLIDRLETILSFYSHRPDAK